MNSEFYIFNSWVNIDGQYAIQREKEIRDAIEKVVKHQLSKNTTNETKRKPITAKDLL